MRQRFYYSRVAHEVTNVGNDTAHLANTAKAAKAALHVDELEAVADRGYFDGEEILACDRAGITVTLPKRMTSGAKSEGPEGAPSSRHCSVLKYRAVEPIRAHAYWCKIGGTGSRVRSPSFG